MFDVQCQLYDGYLSNFSSDQQQPPLDTQKNNQYPMKNNLNKLLAVATIISVSYLTYTKLTKSTKILTLTITIKLTQQLKYQMLLTSIIFAQTLQDPLKPQRNKKISMLQNQQLINYYLQKIKEIYKQKQMMVLSKYGVSSEKFQQALYRYKQDLQLHRIMGDITDIMQKAVHGQYPDLTLDKLIPILFGKYQIKLLYIQVCQIILVILSEKLKQTKLKNIKIDTNNDEQFKKVVRQLNIYEMKIQYLIKKGFRIQWGCPNQVFFKLMENYKLEDMIFKEEMKMLENKYDCIVDIIAQDPLGFDVQTIWQQLSLENNYSNMSTNKILSRSAVQCSSNTFNNNQILYLLNKTRRSYKLIQQQLQPKYQQKQNKFESQEYSKSQVIIDKNQQIQTQSIRMYEKLIN